MKKNRTFHIITIGCQMNKSDSERVSGYLEGFGLERTAESSEADIVILTTCGVRQSAESRVYGLVPKIKKDNPDTILVVTGCLSERSDVKKRLKDKVDIWLPIKELPLFSLKIGIKEAGVLKEHEEDYLKLNPSYNSAFSAYVPIGNGCNNYCTYCVVPYARGREEYRPENDVLDEVRGLAAKGYKEITLIAQNVNSYVSGNKDFPGLLRDVCRIEGDFWLRFATSHPKDMSKKLIDTISENEKICEHIHLPAQSGDNSILKAMNRDYTVEQYKMLVDLIRKKIPRASLSTDIIVGFPGETEEQFENTLKLFEYAKYDMAYIAQFSPRPGTEASKMTDKVSAEIKKEREEKLMEVLRRTSFNNNKKYLDKAIDVLVEGKNRKGVFYGKTRTNKVVKIKGDVQVSIGSRIKVKICNVEDFGMKGEPVR